MCSVPSVEQICGEVEGDDEAMVEAILSFTEALWVFKYMRVFYMLLASKQTS
jgi:hypothetical protein